MRPVHLLQKACLVLSVEISKIVHQPSNRRSAINSSLSEQGETSHAAIYECLSCCLGALSLAVSGILFVLYPLLRPFSDESSLQGAEAFASTAWILAYMLAVQVAFILLALGLLGLHVALQQTAAGQPFAGFFTNLNRLDDTPT